MGFFLFFFFFKMVFIWLTYNTFWLKTQLFNLLFDVFFFVGTALNTQQTTLNKKPLQQVSSSSSTTRSASPLSSQKKKEEDKLFEFLNSNPPSLPTTIANKGYHFTVIVLLQVLIWYRKAFSAILYSIILKVLFSLHFIQTWIFRSLSQFIRFQNINTKKITHNNFHTNH